VLEAPRRGSIETGDSVFYRDEKVGEVVSHGLHADARSVGILVAIESRYASLVRSNTVFWNASGVSADLGLSGLHIHTESFKSLLEGGVAFATPDKPGARAAASSVFALYDAEPKNSAKWAPSIAVGSHKEAKGSAPAEPEEKVHHKQEASGDSKSQHWFHHLFHGGDGGS